MVWLLRTLVVGIFVAVLAFTGGALATQQGPTGSTAAAVGAILLLAAVPIGLLTIVVLTARHFLTRGRRGASPARRGAGGAASRAGGARPAAGGRPTRPRR